MLTDIITHTTTILKTNAKFITAPEIATAVNSAIVEHSRNRPYIKAFDIVSDGLVRQDIPIASGWIQGQSQATKIEYPVGKFPASLIDSDRWAEVEDINAGVIVRRIGFVSVPKNGDTYRFFFTSPHVITGAATTATATEEEAIGHLGAAKACLILAARFAHSAEPSINADAIDYQSKREEFIRQAEEFRREYEVILIGDKTAARPSSVAVRQTAGMILEQRTEVGRYRRFGGS